MRSDEPAVHPVRKLIGRCQLAGLALIGLGTLLVSWASEGRDELEAAAAAASSSTAQG